MTFSIIVPAYKAHTTLERCLDGLKTLASADCEIIIVDSSPDDKSENIIKRFSDFRLIRSPDRLLMHHASNIAAQAAGGKILVFTDADCVIDNRWLRELEESFQTGHKVVGGSILCYPGNNMDMAAHIVKFWKWLPGRGEGNITDLATANFAIDRSVFDQIGGFKCNLFAGDTELSLRLRDNGYKLFFNPQAKVYHIHEHTFASLLRERYIKGNDHIGMLALRERWGVCKRILLIPALPLLVIWMVSRTMKACWQSNMCWDFLKSIHIIVIADAVSIAGGIRGRLKDIFSRVRHHSLFNSNVDYVS
ncbi:MAG: glycosyltransferase [Syntrophales bacterium]